MRHGKGLLFSLYQVINVETACSIFHLNCMIIQPLYNKFKIFENKLRNLPRNGK